MPSRALGCETAQAHAGLGISELLLPKGQMNFPDAQDKLKSIRVSLCFIISVSFSKILCSLSSFYNGGFYNLYITFYNGGNREIRQGRSES